MSKDDNKYTQMNININSSNRTVTFSDQLEESKHSSLLRLVKDNKTTN